MHAEEPVKRERLRINEIFHSLQGEADAAGFRTVFVRLTGCPLRCQYCDTEYAFHAGEWQDIDAHRRAGRRLRHAARVRDRRRAARAAELPPPAHATVRRGPSGLAGNQRRDGYRRVDARVARVVDVKTPGSGEAARNRVENFALLTPRDQLKFVICSREDFDWSKAYLEEHALAGRCQILFSPSYTQVPATQLADWILAERLPVRFQLQLHKILWGDVPGK